MCTQPFIQLDNSNVNGFVSQFTTRKWQIASMRCRFGVLNSVLKLQFLENGGTEGLG